ncbi:MAG: hypothetical protein JWP35_1403 [Caulobacter sp.]|nr:hypothetical protein [Caulobacter sp.]
MSKFLLSLTAAAALMGGQAFAAPAAKTAPPVESTQSAPPATTPAAPAPTAPAPTTPTPSDPATTDQTTTPPSAPATTPAPTGAATDTSTSAPAAHGIVQAGLPVKDNTGAVIGSIAEVKTDPAGKNMVTIKMGSQSFAVEAGKLVVDNGVATINTTQKDLEAMLAPKK